MLAPVCRGRRCLHRSAASSGLPRQTTLAPVCRVVWSAAADDACTGLPRQTMLAPAAADRCKHRLPRLPWQTMLAAIKHVNAAHCCCRKITHCSFTLHELLTHHSFEFDEAGDKVIEANVSLSVCIAHQQCTQRPL